LEFDLELALPLPLSLLLLVVLVVLVVLLLLLLLLFPQLNQDFAEFVLDVSLLSDLESLVGSTLESLGGCVPCPERPGRLAGSSRCGGKSIRKTHARQSIDREEFR
jgi:hypothetical protein